MKTWVLPLSMWMLAGCRSPVARIGSCGTDLNGTWHSEGEGRYRFQVVDEGARILIKPLYPAGGSGTSYGSFQTILRRREKGWPEGSTETTYTEKGKTCPIRFLSRVEDCTPQSVVLVGEANVSVQIQTCEVTRSGALVRSKLIRQPM